MMDDLVGVCSLGEYVRVGVKERGREGEEEGGMEGVCQSALPSACLSREGPMGVAHRMLQPVSVQARACSIRGMRQRSPPQCRW